MSAGDAGERSGGVLGRIEEIAEAQARRIRDLEAAEERLREQDFSYRDARIGEGYRALLRTLEGLASAVLTAPAEAWARDGELVEDSAPPSPARELVLKVVDLLVKKRLLPRTDPVLPAGEIEQEHRAQLGSGPRHGRGLRPG